MKKKLFSLVLACVMTSGMFVGCGSSSSISKDTDGLETEETTVEDEETTTERDYDMGYDVFDYVTLGDYKGVEVTLDGDYEVTDEDIESYIEAAISSDLGYVEDEAATVVEEDSIVNVDYVGSEDGVAFDGGSAEDVTLDVAANGDISGTTYIDGFTAGLVGSNVGDEVAYEVTFPDTYGNEDLAGHTVVFTFQVNWIGKEVTADNITDDIVAANTDYTTVEEYKEALAEDCQAEMDETIESDTTDAVMETVINNATVTGVPENLLNGLVHMYTSSLESYYCSDGQTLEEFVTEQGDDYDEMIAEIQDEMTESIKEELVFEAVAKTEDLELDEETFESMLDYYMYYYGATDEDNLSELYDTEDFSMIAYLHHIYELQQALTFCTENAVVNY